MAKKKDFDGIVEESFAEGYNSEPSATPSLPRKKFTTLARLASEMESREDYVHWIPGFQPDMLGHIWDIAHGNIRDIRSHASMTQAEFSDVFLMSKRAVESWEGGQRECPLYLKLLLAEATGYLQIDIK